MATSRDWSKATVGTATELLEYISNYSGTDPSTGKRHIKARGVPHTKSVLVYRVFDERPSFSQRTKQRLTGRSSASTNKVAYKADHRIIGDYHVPCTCRHCEDCLTGRTTGDSWATTTDKVGSTTGLPTREDLADSLKAFENEFMSQMERFSWTNQGTGLERVKTARDDAWVASETLLFEEDYKDVIFCLADTAGEFRKIKDRTDWAYLGYRGRKRR